MEARVVQMAFSEIRPAHDCTANDDFESLDGSSATALLDRYRHDSVAMQRLRLALFATNEQSVHSMNDHEVLVAAHGKLIKGQLKAKKDLCDKRDEKNRKYRDFIDAHRDDAAKIAATLRNNVENILGLSALESSFGSSRFAVEGSNFFGLHGSSKAPLPNQKSLIPAKGDPTVGMAVYENYLASAESFAKTKGQLVIAVTDPRRFATILQTKGKFGIGPTGPIQSYVGDLVNVIGNVAKRLNC
jgi:hypothetical protein